MELDFSRDSVAFSDIAAPSHVSELESFSDFEFSDNSSVEFAPLGVRKIEESPGNTAGVDEKSTTIDSMEKYVAGEKER